MPVTDMRMNECAFKCVEVPCTYLEVYTYHTYISAYCATYIHARCMAVYAVRMYGSHRLGAFTSMEGQ